MLYSDYLKDKSHNAIKLNNVEGVPCILNHSKGKDLKNYEIYGNSCQATRSGKNLFDMDTILPQQGWVKQDDGSYYVANNSTMINKVLWENTEEYTGQLKILFQVKYADDNKNGSYIWVNYTDGTYLVVYYTGTVVANTWYYPTSSRTITDSNKIVQNIIWTYGTGSTSTWVKDIIITKDTTVTAYEQYGVSPSPEYPSEIQSVGDLVSSGEHAGKYKIPVSVRGKNIWNNNTLNLAAHNTKTETGFILTGYSNVIKDGSVFKEEAQLKVGDIIRFSYIVVIRETPSGSIGSVYFGNLCPVSISLTPKGIGTYQVISDYVVTSLDFNNVRFYGDNKGKSVEYKNVQIIKVDVASYKNTINEGNNIDWNYEPYVKPITTNIYLNEPLRKVGDYSDYVDFKKQKVVRQIKEITFDGTENWGYVDTNKVVYLHINNLASSKYCYSTHFLSEATRDTISPYFRPVTDILRLYQRNGNVLYSSADEFKTFLANQNTAGTPLIVDYILTTPTEENIALPALKTFKGKSIISADTSVLPSNIKVKYVRT